MLTDWTLKGVCVRHQISAPRSAPSNTLHPSPAHAHADSLIYEREIGILCKSDLEQVGLAPIFSLTHPRKTYDSYFTDSSLTVNFQRRVNLASICHHQNHLHVSSVLESLTFCSYSPLRTSGGSSLRPCLPTQWLGSGTG